MKALARMQRHAKRAGALMGFTALLAGLMGVAAFSLSAFGTVSVAEATPAVSTCGTAKVHYEVTASSAPIMITKVVLSGLTGCDGKTATLQLRGNTTGTSSTSAKTPPISTASSKVNPCNGTPETSPTTITTGSITLALCKSPTSTGHGPYVNVHNLTHLTLTVGGATTRTGAVVFTKGPSGHSGSNGNTTTAEALAFTGADIAAMVAAGVLLLALGTLLLLWERRRHRRSAGSEA